MNTKFTNDEYADIYFVYGFSVENARAGVEKRGGVSLSNDAT